MTKRCTICRAPFKPSHRGARGRAQKTCGDPRCHHAQIGRTRRGVKQPKTSQTLHRKANAKVQARLRETFGELSVREISVFKFAWRTAFRRGYDLGRYALKPRTRSYDKGRNSDGVQTG